MGNPNYSSAVINNCARSRSITIDGNYVIPGTAFYELYSYPGRTLEYYQTAESINAKGGEFFKVYILEEGVGGKTYYITYDTENEENYNFFTGSLAQKRDRFIEIVSPYISSYNSYVDLDPEAISHILGVGVTATGAIVHEGTTNKARLDYYEIKDTLTPRVLRKQSATNKRRCFPRFVRPGRRDSRPRTRVLRLEETARST